MAVNSIKSLPIVGSSENLQKLLANYIGQNNGVRLSGDTRHGAIISATPQMTIKQKGSLDGSATASKSEGRNAADVTTDHSTTNLQVAGVDEEDLVKTDGEYIFKVNAQKIINVIKADPASAMEAVNNITFDDNYSINGIFLKKNILVVVGNSYQNVDPQENGQSTDSIMGPSYEVTKVMSFDITDKKNIKKVREIEIDGFYASSRMIGSRVYIIANKYLNFVGNIKEDVNVGNAYYRDSVLGKDKIAIDFKSINYLPDSIQPNYIMVASYNVDDNKVKAAISSILGSGNSIYSSDKNLYIAGIKGTENGNNNGSSNTILYKFEYENTGVKFVAKGEVPGTITNQFSMDEKEDYFRIATTESNYSQLKQNTDGKQNVQNQITNNLFVLDKDMKTVGKLQGLANGEQIYSVRFISNRAYIVTYMLTDPLFVIDLTNPTAPKVLGELKIPGFSNYLHPYDDTHLIGFGMDTTVVKENGTDMARPQGMKIAIFDVSNVAKPVQQFMTTIGGNGTYSEVLNNPKALLFSKEKKLLALPVNVNNYDNNTSQQGYQGAYIYSIDLVNGIKLKGEITHTDSVASQDTKSKSLMPDYIDNGQYYVDRILYIKDTLYTLSNSLIKANDIKSLKEESKLKLKTVDYSKGYPTDGVKEIVPMPAK